MTETLEKIINRFTDDIRKLLQDNLVAEYLFGSTAGTEREKDSDIDILIIVKKFDYKLREQLSALASEYSISYGYLISPILKDSNLWEKNKNHKTLLYQEIQREGVRLC